MIYLGWSSKFFGTANLTKLSHLLPIAMVSIEYLAKKAYLKLAQEVQKPDLDLRTMVAHANMIDMLLGMRQHTRIQKC